MTISPDYNAAEANFASAAFSYDEGDDDFTLSPAITGGQVYDPLRRFSQQFIGRGIVSLHNIKDILCILIHLGLLYLANLQSTKHFMSIIAVTVLMRRNGNRRVPARRPPRFAKRQAAGPELRL